MSDSLIAPAEGETADENTGADTNGGGTDTGGATDNDTSGDTSDVGGDELIFGKYKDMDAATDAFKGLESENGTLRRQKVPEAPDSYSFDAFADDKDLKGLIEEGYDFSEDPYLKGLDEVFKKHNLSQEAVADIVKGKLMVDGEFATNALDELAKLGPKGNEIVDEVKGFVGKNFSESERGLIEEATTTAEGIQLIHKLMKMAKGAGTIPSGEGAGTAQTSSTELFEKAMEIKRKYGDDLQYNTGAIAEYERHMNAAIAAEEKGH